MNKKYILIKTFIIIVLVFLISDKLGYEMPFKNLMAPNIERVSIGPLAISSKEPIVLNEDGDIKKVVNVLRKIKHKSPLEDVNSVDNTFYHIVLNFRDGKEQTIVVSQNLINIDNSWYIIDSNVANELVGLYGKFAK